MLRAASKPYMSGDTSFIAALKAQRVEPGRGPAPRHKCYYFDEEGHFKERCPARLNGFPQGSALTRGNCPMARPQTPTGNRASRAASPATSKKQVKFAEANQMLPVVAEGYGRKRVAAISYDAESTDVPVCHRTSSPTWTWPL